MAKSSEEINREYNESYKRTHKRDPHSGKPLPGHPDYRAPGTQHYSDSCFVAGTLISTPMGQRRIEHIQEGDLVWAIGLTGALQAKPVLRRRDHRPEQIWRLLFEDGTLLQTTPIHAFFSEKKWRKAADLKAGDQVDFIQAGVASETKTVKNQSTHRMWQQCIILL